MNARTLAINILARVRATDAYLNVVLDTALSEHPPKDPRDASLVTELTYGATRRQMALDYAITRFADRKLDALEDKVLAALRVGAYQLFHTRVPARAAVAETVQALKDVGLARAAGFTNAILRKLSELPSAPLPSQKDAVEYLSVRESHPRWLVERWIRQFGRERAEAMLVANNLPPAVVVRANTSKVTRDALLAQFKDVGVDARPTEASPVGIILPPVGKVEDLYGYAEGLWQVQDEAAQLVGVYGQIPESARVLDACAAPGGKACHQAETHDVVAVDLHANKLRK
ncbi:MAG: 16S rRNA (cytosine(967)-C(5))-methyltransferase RsmB, partial [Myxococcaceae bacterium]